MEKILAIATIADDRQKAKEIACRVQHKRLEGDNRTFAEILQEEVDKVKKEATEDTRQNVQDSKANNSSKL